MMYPDDPFKGYWDIFIALVLIFTSLVTPYRIALVEVDNTEWNVINNTVDVMFLVDIFIIFNSAYEDEDFNLIDQRKVIAKTYLKGWFFIDVFAIFPFHLILGSADFGDIVRITKIGKMYKLVKLTRLLRVLKIVKEKSKIAKYLQQVFKIGVGMQRLVTFAIITFIIIHIVACLWIMTGADLGDP